MWEIHIPGLEVQSSFYAWVLYSIVLVILNCVQVGFAIWSDRLQTQIAVENSRKRFQV